MATAAQIRANNENAKKSTGPRSDEGKSISSKNALSHGILSANTYLPDEDEVCLKELREDIFNVYQPSDTIELALVERITLGHFKQIRLQAAEAARINISMNPDILIKEINQILDIPDLEQLTSEDLTNENELGYQNIIDAEKEFNSINIDLAHQNLSELQIKTPIIWASLEQEAKKLKMSWGDFSNDPNLVTKTLRSFLANLKKLLKRIKTIQTAKLLMKQLKIAKRIPDGKDFELLSRYQTQTDNEIFKATERLKLHRKEKMRTIEGELVELN